jgi:hypothetical protein
MTLIDSKLTAGQQTFVDAWVEWFSNNVKDMIPGDAMKYAELLVSKKVTTVERLATAVEDNSGFLTEIGINKFDAKDVLSALENREQTPATNTTATTSNTAAPRRAANTTNIAAQTNAATTTTNTQIATTNTPASAMAASPKTAVTITSTPPSAVTKVAPQVLTGTFMLCTYLRIHNCISVLYMQPFVNINFIKFVYTTQIYR